MSQHPNLSSNLPPPRSEIPSQISRHSSSRITSSPSRSGSQSSTPNLPSYNDIILANSTRARSGSESNMQKEFGKLRKSFRSSSMRRKSRKARPQITIVSSEPMNHHPAFADGSKGSCVPPEAPPSYNEAIKESSGNSQTQEASTTNDAIYSPALVAGFSSSASASTSRNDIDLCLQTNDNPHLITPLTPSVISARTNCDRINGDNLHLPTTLTTSTSPVRASSPDHTQPRSSSLLAHIQPIKPLVPTRTNASASPSHPQPAKPSKPAVPKKPTLLLHTMQNPTSNSQSLATNQSKPSSTNGISSNGPDASNKITSSPRRLPPPPRPPAAPKKAIQVDEKSGYASIKNGTSDVDKSSAGNPNTADLCEVSGYATIGNVAKSILKSESSNSSSIKESNKSNESSENPSFKQENVKDKPEKEPNTESKAGLEPTYAVFKKSSSAKRVHPTVNNHDDDDHEENEVEEKAPPPIPTTRPPVEDYQGLFHNSGSSQQQATHAAKEIADVFGNEKSEDLISKEDPYSKIDVPQRPNKPPVPKHIVKSVAHKESSKSMEREQLVSIEPPYQTVFFKQEGDCAKVGSGSRPPPKHPPKPNSAPPPLPPFPAAGTKENSNSLNKGASLPAHVTTAKSESSLKKHNVMKRKSLKLKEKSRKIFKPKKSLDDSGDNQRLNEPISSAEGKNRNAAKLSEPASSPASPNHVNKVKRTPPPRPALPLVLKNKLQKPTTPTKVVSFVDDLISLSDVDNKPDVSPSVELSKQNSSLPPKHPPPVSPVLTHKPDTHSAAPVAVPRKRNDGQLVPISESVAPINHHTSAKTSTPAPSKPSRPPPACKPAANEMTQSTDADQFPLNSKEADNDDKDKSLLDIINENKNESAKAQVDHLMKSYVSSEVICVATRDYRPSNFTDLSFVAGEKILVIKEIDSELLFGRNEVGEEGPFPKNYVSVELNKNNSNIHRLQNAPVARKRQSLRRTAPRTELLGKAKAIYAYSSDNPDDLSFTADVEIDVVGHVGSHWLKGKIGSRVGMFPRNFVSFTPSKKSDQKIGHFVKQTYPIVIALHDFTTEFDNELSFKIGDKIEVINRVDHEWLEGKLNGNTGIIPVAFLDTSKLDSSSNTQQSTTDGMHLPNKRISPTKVKGEREATANHHSTAVALYDFKGDDDTELSFRESDVITITGKVDIAWLRGKLGERTGIFPAAFVSISS